MTKSEYEALAKSLIGEKIQRIEYFEINYDGYETDFSGARKWRTFWVKTRIFKPNSTLLAYDALGGAQTDSIRQVANANEQLRTIYGDTEYHHFSYIPRPTILASFFDPKLDQDTGVILQKKITSIFDGQQH